MLTRNLKLRKKEIQKELRSPKGWKNKTVLITTKGEIVKTTKRKKKRKT